MSETVYIETSIVGYLTARSSKNLIIAANIEVTRDWWDSYRNSFTLYISKVVLDEVAKGDLEIAANRLEVLRGFPLLELSPAVQDLAAEFCLRSNLPPKASDDAVHIAAATVHGMDYLLTWNCKHIANAQIQRKLSEIGLDFGYELPTICTPYELMGG
jgi:predicted nucleic acid-binding protein